MDEFWVLIGKLDILIPSRTKIEHKNKVKTLAPPPSSLDPLYFLIEKFKELDNIR